MKKYNKRQQRIAKRIYRLQRARRILRNRDILLDEQLALIRTEIKALRKQLQEAAK